MWFLGVFGAIWTQTGPKFSSFMCTPGFSSSVRLQSGSEIQEAELCERNCLTQAATTRSWPKPNCFGAGKHSTSNHSNRMASPVGTGTPLGTVQSLLGHSSPEITRGTYIHSLPAGAKEAVQKVEDLLTGPKRTQIVEIHKMASSLIQ